MLGGIGRYFQQGDALLRLRLPEGSAAAQVLAPNTATFQAAIVTHIHSPRPKCCKQPSMIKSRIMC